MIRWARVATCVLLVGLVGGCLDYTPPEPPTPLPGPSLEEFTRIAQPLLIEYITRLAAETGIEFEVRSDSKAYVRSCYLGKYGTWQGISDRYHSVAIPEDIARRVGDEVLGKAFPRFSSETASRPTPSDEPPHRILYWSNPDTGGVFTVSINPRAGENFTRISWDSGCRTSPKYDEWPTWGWIPRDPPDASRRYTTVSFTELAHPLLEELLARLGEATGEQYVLPPPPKDGFYCGGGGTSVSAGVDRMPYVDPGLLLSVGSEVLAEVFPVFRDESTTLWRTFLWTNEAEDGWFMLASYPDEETTVGYRSACLAVR